VVSRKPQGGVTWADQSGTGIDLYGATFIRALCEAHRLRTISASASQQDAEPDPTARGVAAVYDDGLWVPVQVLERFVRCELDDDLIADYLRGLLTLGCPPRTVASYSTDAPLYLPDPGLSLLLPFYGTRDLSVWRRDRATGEKTLHTVRLAPRPEWLPRLAARGVTGIADDVRLRLRLAGLPPLATSTRLPGRLPGTVTSDQRHRSEQQQHQEGARLAAALLLAVSPRARERALSRTCAVEVQRRADAPANGDEGVIA
jgi:CRISPR-associated protein Csx17